jgi:hypothetical protein
MGNSELRVQGCELFILEGPGMRIVQNPGFSDAGSSELRVHGCRQFGIEGSWVWAVQN